MIVTCSSCATRYLMDAASLGPNGREVRCARCGHVWHQPPPEDLPKSIDAAPSAPQATDLLPAYNLSAPPPARPSRGLIMGWAALLLTVALIGAGFYSFRSTVAEIWPASIRLYAKLGIPLPRVTLEDVRYRRERQAGISLLLVQGRIVNASERPARVPSVRIALRDNTRREITQMEVEATETRLKPGDRTEFAVRLTNPPPEAQNLEVSLVRR